MTVNIAAKVLCFLLSLGFSCLSEVFFFQTNTTLSPPTSRDFAAKMTGTLSISAACYCVSCVRKAGSSAHLDCLHPVTVIDAQLINCLPRPPIEDVDDAVITPADDHAAVFREIDLSRPL
jgi:hypothetical protein